MLTDDFEIRMIGVFLSNRKIFYKIRGVFYFKKLLDLVFLATFAIK